ncbi:MAG: bifunctional [glutamate--ammonia ligase]-adenylyl-L-tyrosine phosphorylase/[glutamate--ammonia-ligase] adenylyltransferase, partial [Mariprofundaceae bacterium]
MSGSATQPWLLAAHDQQSAAHRLFAISPFFKELMREANEAECHAVLRHADGYDLPNVSCRWTPSFDDTNDVAAWQKILRQHKQRGLRRVIWWELGLHQDVMVSAHALSNLAEQLLQAALQMAVRMLAERHGVVPDGRFCILGLGKLGGHELNLGSDVDLIFIWEAESPTSDGRVSLDASAYYQRLSRAILKLMDEITSDGRAWICDMRLRPGGASSPVCLSLDATLNHYEGYGQTWERAVLIKARPVAGDLGLGQALIEGIRPFVYRRYLDYTTVHALAEMKARIDAQTALAPGKGFDVKRGLGGIREIEFLTQSMQLLHGGRDPDIRVQGSLPALECLRLTGHIEADQAAMLAAAYCLWRRIEHAIQARKGEQTHALPPDAGQYLDGVLSGRNILGAAHGKAATVHALFAATMTSVLPTSHSPTSWLDIGEDERRRRLAGEEEEDMQRIMLAIDGIRDLSRRGLLPERSISQIRMIVDAGFKAWEGDANRVQAVETLVELFWRIGGRATWIDLLAAHEGARRWLFDALAASRYIAEHVIKDPNWLEWPLQRERGMDRMQRIHAQLSDLSAAEPDDEQLMADVGRLVDAGRLTTAMAIAADEADPLTVGAWQATTADLAIKALMRLSLRQLKLPMDFPFVCLALGKQGSLEMGLVSDLDLVFLLCHDDPASAGPKGRSMREWAQRIGRRLIAHLTAAAPYGVGYELDARLRPSGQSGVLVTTLKGFSDYQQREAHTWEHQALCRARPAAGPTAARKKTQEALNEVLALPRDFRQLAQDV